MKKSFVCISIMLISYFGTVVLVSAQKKDPPKEKELAEISSRGRMLAEYDTAAWHSTDSVKAVTPDGAGIERYVAKKSSGGWSVAYGRFSEKRDKFLIAYEAMQGATKESFNVKKYEPPKEDSGFYFLGALALETAIAGFTGEQRPYNAAVIPAPNEQMWVYIVPAPTVSGVWPLGGDVRYLISQDGKQIVGKRQLHKTIVDYKTSDNGKEITTSFHVAVLDDILEDTDVFFVLTRKPFITHWVITENFAFVISADGTIVVLSKEVFLKIVKEK